MQHTLMLRALLHIIRFVIIYQVLAEPLCGCGGNGMSKCTMLANKLDCSALKTSNIHPSECPGIYVLRSLSFIFLFESVPAGGYCGMASGVNVDSRSDCVSWEGFNHVLCVSWRNDNWGESSCVFDSSQHERVGKTLCVYFASGMGAAYVVMSALC